MGLHIINHEAEKIAAFLAQSNGHTVEEEVLEALRERANRLQAAFDTELYQDLKAISEESAKIPLLDARSADAILYDANGLPQ